MINTYLKKIDPETGKIILKETRGTPKVECAKFYGSVKFLERIQDEFEIFEDLDSIPITMAPNIMGAAIASAINLTSFDSLHYTVEGSVIKGTMKLRGTLSPSTVDELSEKVGSMMVTVDRFFSKRVKRTSSDFFSLELTSTSSYSDMEN